MAFTLPWHWHSTSNEINEQDSDDSQVGASQKLDGPATPSLMISRNSLGSLLEHYNNPGVPPPSSRINPLLNQEIRKPLRLFELWKYGYFVASKGKGICSQRRCGSHDRFESGAEIFSDVMSHYIWGPRRPSWGIEMTLISSFMRNTNRHTQLADIVSKMFYCLRMCVEPTLHSLLENHTRSHGDWGTCPLALECNGHASYLSGP